MVTQRQVIAILAVLGATAGFGFAIINLYYAWKYPDGVTARRAS